ncbi:hypothetical protein SCLCIDRAFT_252408 [Scleroderma citrinum Foug A]|uniref:Uncharacterized protein n=1 Tax=Scleroderma citrinum Foug A TaxID=1036808 RepID=A0A0C3EFQ3_9AGAM|nr:hypothetical protein SCLCIDRAFT_252408 [Scleroderma citrinum Foug A]
MMDDVTNSSFSKFLLRIFSRAGRIASRPGQGRTQTYASACDLSQFHLHPLEKVMGSFKLASTRAIISDVLIWLVRSVPGQTTYLESP